MNFNITGKSFVNFDLKKKVEDKKEQESQKGNNEIKAEENKTPRVEGPKPKKITADAEDVMANYAKGLMLPNRDGENVNSLKSPRELHECPTLDKLINQWRGNNEQMNNQEKFDLLTQIIDAFGDDEEGARIWRVRRFTAHFKISQQQLLDFWRENSGNEYSIHDLPQRPEYEGYQDDAEAVNYLNAHGGTPEERLVNDERLIEGFAYRAIYLSLASMANDCNNPQLSGDASSYAGFCMLHINLYVNSQLNANEPWHDFYVNEYKPLFDKFKNNISEMSSEQVQNLVGDFQRMIEKLREQGFPYCDELLIAIQGYLVYAGADDMNVLPNPDNN